MTRILGRHYGYPGTPFMILGRILSWDAIMTEYPGTPL